MGRDGSTAKTSDPGSAILVDQDVGLGHEVGMNWVTEVCGVEGGAPSRGFRGRYPGRACGSSTELLSSAVIEKRQRTDKS